MAAPMTPAQPSRDQQIKAKEDAIKRKLETSNMAAKTGASVSVAKDIAKMKRDKKYGTVSKSYNTQAIKGANKGFTKSDYGVGAGAAIPYQIGSSKKTISKTLSKPKPPPKPKPKSKPKSGGHSNYTVKRGDTLSGIAKKHGTDWKSIWDYNLKNRNAKTQAILRRRGPNLIYKGGTFLIPKK